MLPELVEYIITFICEWCDDCSNSRAKRYMVTVYDPCFDQEYYEQISERLLCQKCKEINDKKRPHQVFREIE
jgi:hypothetical protein